MVCFCLVVKFLQVSDFDVVPPVDFSLCPFDGVPPVVSILSVVKFLQVFVTVATVAQPEFGGFPS